MQYRIKKKPENKGQSKKERNSKAVLYEIAQRRASINAMLPVKRHQRQTHKSAQEIGK